MDDPKTAARWVSAWSTSPIDASLSEAGVLDRLGVAVSDVSARTAVQLTAGGTHVRLTLSNIFGVLPLHVAACTVALGADDARGIDPATLRTVTFGGQTHVRIGAGESCTSDAAALPVAAGQTLTVTVFYRGINAMRTIGLIGGCSHAEIGNCTRRPMLHMAVPMQHTADSGAYEVIPALTEVDVLAAAGTHACVIFGDSTVANELPRLLAARLRADGIRNVSVTQAAIKGDRLVADGVGRAAKLLGGAGVKRFGRDVLGQAGADMVLVKLGANDLIHPHCRSKQGLLTPVTFAQMTAGYRALADMAHAQGVRIWFCELTPWKGYTRNLFGRGDDIQWSPEYDALRLELNAWFQSADCPADGYIPLDALADPDDPDALIPAYTTDGVHHTPAGQRALAALIPEDIFVTQEAVPRAIIRPAAAHDLARIEEIYDTIHTAEEAGKVSIGWVRGVYPTRATAQAGLDAGDLFVLADGGTVYAAGRINREQVPVYAEMPWAHDVPPEQVLVLHTLVVDPAVAGHGCGTQFVRFYEQRARALGCPELRIDTNAKNANARRLYAYLGYREAGVAPCTFNGIDGVALVCLEKWLGSEP